MSNYDQAPPQPSTPGDTVAQRMAFWRSLTWEELVAFMVCGEGERLPRGDLLTAPGVAVQLRRK